MNQSTPYSIPQEPGRWRAITLAAVVHAALFAFLWFGIRWQNEKPIAVEAEIWSPNTQEAAPVAPQRIPEPVPLPPIEKPVEKPAPVIKPEPQIENPEIALEQEKKRKVRQEEREQEREQKQLAQKRLEKELLREKEVLKDKEAAQAEKEKAQKKREAEDAKKIAADKKRKQDAAEDAKLDKLRAEEMNRMTGGTSSASGNGGAGTAAKSQGNRGDPGYGDRIKAKIKSNTIFNVPNDLDGNPPAIYEVNLLPDGTIRSMDLKKKSGVPGFDEAVRRGIEKSEPYPKDKSGEVPSSFELTYKPKD